MKRKKIKKLIIILILIIIAIVIIYKIFNKKSENTKYLVQIFDQINFNQTYLFEIQTNDKTKTIMAKKDDQIIIDDYSENSHSTTIVKDDITYLIFHDREEYYVYTQSNVDKNYLLEGLSEIKDKPFLTGTEKIKGKKYLYEEYNGSTMFMKDNNSEISEDEIKTRFYFDSDGSLTYIKTLKGSYQELLKVSVTNEVDDSIFEIPSNYAENSNN